MARTILEKKKKKKQLWTSEGKQIISLAVQLEVKLALKKKNFGSYSQL